MPDDRKLVENDILTAVLRADAQIISHGQGNAILSPSDDVIFASQMTPDHIHLGRPPMSPVL